VPDLRRMALLWEQLPADSRTARLQEPSLEWGTEAYLLWRIEYGLRSLTWALQYDKKHPTPAPEPLPNPSELAKSKARQERALADREEIAELLGLEGIDG